MERTRFLLLNNMILNYELVRMLRKNTNDIVLAFVFFRSISMH